MRFVAAVQMSAAEGGAADRRFDGVAYGGGVITDHGWWDAVAFDLTGLTAAVPLPLLLQHDQDRAIGVIDRVENTGTELRVGGRLFTAIEPEAARVAAKADAGMPWQMSVGIFPDAIEEIAAGRSTTVNGRDVAGRAHVFRKSRVREASLVAIGADSATGAHVFGGAEAARRVPFIDFTGGCTMHENIDPAAALAQMTAERDAERARAEAAERERDQLREQFAARERSDREAAVRAMLGEEFSAEHAAPYLEMTPAQFAAVQAAVGSARSRLPQGFTAEQGRGGAAAAITVEAIDKYRRDHPGATYDQAFAALKSPGLSGLPTTFAG